LRLRMHRGDKSAWSAWWRRVIATAAPAARLTPGEQCTRWFALHQSSSADIVRSTPEEKPVKLWMSPKLKTPEGSAMAAGLHPFTSDTSGSRPRGGGAGHRHSETVASERDWSDVRVRPSNGRSRDAIADLATRIQGEHADGGQELVAPGAAGSGAAHQVDGARLRCGGTNREAGRRGGPEVRCRLGRRAMATGFTMSGPPAACFAYSTPPLDFARSR